jgi:hypothetical protein
MMNTRVGLGAGLVVLVSCVACGPSEPIAPTRPSAPTTTPDPAPSPRPTKEFPPASGPSRTFIFAGELKYPVRDYTKKSRLVLYDNGAFELQFPTIGPGGYRGGYTVTNDVISFEWEGWSTAGPWAATGTITGESIAIQYNLIMQMTDFEDAVYALERTDR